MTKAVPTYIEWDFYLLFPALYAFQIKRLLPRNQVFGRKKGTRLLTTSRIINMT